MATSKRNTPRKSGGRKGSPPWLVLILLLSLCALGGSLWMLHQEKQKNAEKASVTEKALKMAKANPDAEVFQVEDQPAPEKKK